MGNSNERGHFNPTEEEMDGLGEDAAEAATLRALDSNLRRYYAGRECRFQSIASRLIHRNLLY